MKKTHTCAEKSNESRAFCMMTHGPFTFGRHNFDDQIHSGQSMMDISLYKSPTSNLWRRIIEKQQLTKWEVGRKQEDSQTCHVISIEESMSIY